MDPVNEASAAPEPAADPPAIPALPVEPPPPEPLPAPQPPRVWPVFAVFFGGFAFLTFVQMILMFSRLTEIQPDWVRNPADIAKVIPKVVADPSFLLKAAVLNATFFIAVGLLARTRASAAKISAPAIALGTLFFLGVTQTLTALVSFGHVAGLSVTLPVLGKAMQSMGHQSLPGTIFVIALLPAVGEELFFRGYMQPRLVQRWGVRPGILVTALLFGFMHFDPVHSPLAFFMGLALGWMFHRTGRLWTTIVAHLINNALAVLVVALPGAAAHLTSPLRLAGAVLLMIPAGIAFQRVTRPAEVFHVDTAR